MKLLDKLKNAIFEEDEFEELERHEEEIPKKKEEPKQIEEVVKKIDIEKTIPKKVEVPKEETPEPKPMKREYRRTPVIFSEEDLILEEKQRPISRPKKEERRIEEVKKPLYGGHKEEKPKEKFKPSPIISPVYGFVGVSPILEQPRNDEISSFNEMFAKEKKPEVTLDEVREKAFGNTFVQEDDDLGLLYEMKRDDAPAITKLTLGDAVEYFEDLGLEYNIDYKDSAKEKQLKKNSPSKTTRSTKNKDLSDQVEEVIRFEKELEATRELEITKEQLKPKSAKEIKKVKKISDSDLGMVEDKEEPEEKSLYDLIDMMYETK